MSSKLLSRREEMLPSIVNDFFNTWNQRWGTDGWSFPTNQNLISVPAVNIKDNKDHYEISLAAPGMKKEDFTIDVEGKVLTISAETEAKKEEKDEQFTRKEYNYSSFSRSFTLPEGIVQDKIDATYENGLLRLVLPEAKKQTPRHITVK